MVVTPYNVAVQGSTNFLRMAFLLEHWKDLPREQQNTPAGMSAIRRKQSLPILGPPRTCSCRTPQKLLAGPKFDLPRPWLSWKKSASGDGETGNWAKHYLARTYRLASGVSHHNRVIPLMWDQVDT